MRWRDSRWTGHPSEAGRCLLRRKGSRAPEDIGAWQLLQLMGYICGEALGLLQHLGEFVRRLTDYMLPKICRVLAAQQFTTQS
jgi:hypothetical protein